MPILIESFDDVSQYACPQYLVKPLLEMGSTAMLFAPSGGGKTFVAIDIACSIATGLSWGGMSTHCAPVVYITAEGGRAFGRRINAWYLRALTRIAPEDHDTFTDVLRANLHIIRSAVQIGDDAVRDELFDAIRAKVPAEQAIGIIVIDTLARCSIGYEEKDNDDMTMYVDKCVDLKTRLRATGQMDGHIWNADADEAYEPVVLIIHHTGHIQPGGTGGLRERGASALRAALDVVIGLEAGEPLSIAVHKMKDGEAPLPMAVTWDDTQVVGADEDGVELRGRVAVVLAPGTAQTADEKRKEAKGAEWTALEAAIMRLMVKRPSVNLQDIADDLNLGRATIGRRVKALTDAGKVRKNVTENEWIVEFVSPSQSPFLH